ncbi:MAG: hypothetical protein U0S13_06780 [Mycobacterium sp.]
MEPSIPKLSVFTLVGAATSDNKTGLTLEELADYVSAVLEKGESVRLGFYDEGYPESAEFWPKMQIANEHLRSMKVFTGAVGFNARFPGCLIITHGEAGPEAVLTYVPMVTAPDLDDDA